MTPHYAGYRGRAISFATMHGKELLAREAFQRILGADVTAPEYLDTDQFGTFAGDIPRTLAPVAAARAKARLGMQITGTRLGLASEGSFSAGLATIESRELLVFIDDELGFELVEKLVGMSPIPGGRKVSAVETALDFATTAGFPTQGVIIQARAAGRMTAHKSLADLPDLERTVTALLASGAELTILPDYRAHRSPTRAESIRDLCTRLAERLATTCPTCAVPGFGQLGVERGVPCAQCGLPTQLVAAHIVGCQLCGHRERHPRDATSADPQWCDFCNP
jgi:hypothetical protein